MLSVGNNCLSGYDVFYNSQYTTFRVAIYIRLSREDEQEGISGSVINQRDFLTKYVRSQTNWVLEDIYIDDGFTGTNFNRPSFIKLKNDIENEKIDLVITKDLSRLRERLYRNWLLCGKIFSV